MTHDSLRALALAAAVGVIGSATTAQAEMEISVYSGWQTSPHSRVEGRHGSQPIPANPEIPMAAAEGIKDGPVGDGPSLDAGQPIDALIGWKGKSLSPPPYYGIRATWWRSDVMGYGLEFTHAKAYAPKGEAADAGFDRLEFSDGHNIITLNAQRRWPGQWNALTPYVGGGFGLALPHVDAVPSSGGKKTYGYQLTGPAMRLYAGASYAINEDWSVFGEYQFTHSWNKVDLESGGDFKTNITTNALNMGVSFSF